MKKTVAKKETKKAVKKPAKKTMAKKSAVKVKAKTSARKAVGSNFYKGEMARLHLVKPAKPYTSAMVKKVEQMAGVKLPADYLAFLKKQNGGWPRENTFIVRNREVTIKQFFCIGSKNMKSYMSSSTLEYLLDSDTGLFGKGVVPVALIEPGHLVCLKISGAKATVGIWKRPKSDNPPELSHVANTFTEFVNMLADFAENYG